EHATSGVRIQFDAAARLTGRVVDGAGGPAPWAAVRVARATGGGGNREALADEDGRFDIDGLPRAKMDVVAVAETASSKVVAVDLAAPPEELTLTLDVAGQIGGTVVDGAGEPRSEEHTSELQSRENLVCRLLLEK